MTDDMMALRGLLEKSSDADLLREMIGFRCTTCRDVERWTSRVLIVTLVGILIIGHAGNFLGQ